MVYIILGLMLGCCGLLLWWLDRRRRAAAATTAKSTGVLEIDEERAAVQPTSMVVGGVEVHPVPLGDEDNQPPVNPINTGTVGVAQGEEEIDSAEDIIVAQTIGDDAARKDSVSNTAKAATEEEPRPTAEITATGTTPEHGDSALATEKTSADTTHTFAQAATTALEQADVVQQEFESGVQPESEQPRAIDASVKGRSRWRRIHLPGLNLQKRERQQWAAQHGFEYTKSDALLADEWTRNAAATGAPARDVVSGIVAGYEVHFADVAGVSIMALRRAVASEIIIEFERKGEFSEPQQAADETFQETALVPVATLGDYAYSSTEPAVAQRMIDTRLHEVVAKLNDHIVRIWTEYEWLLLEWDEQATIADWDETLMVAAQLANITRVLPPTPGSLERALRKTQLDPSRNLPDYFPEPVHPLEHSEDALPQVAREAAAVNLPTRGQAQQHGAVELRGVGTDEVSAIGDGQKPADDHFGTRVLRTSTGSSIFDDIAAELGTDPLEDMSFPGWDEDTVSSTKPDSAEIIEGVEMSDDANSGNQGK